MAPKKVLAKPAASKALTSKPAASSARTRSRTPAKAAASEVPSETLKSMKALLLGLERRPDRRQRAMEMFAKEVPWLQVEFFRATDGKVDTILDTEVAETWNTKNNSNYGSYEDIKNPDGSMLHTAAEFADPGVVYKFSPGERGCAHSHYRMWKVVAESSGPMLILEDDVQLVFDREGMSPANGKTFTPRFEQAVQEAIKKDADVLYLGWSGFRDGNYKFHKSSRGAKPATIRKAEYVWTTVAYVLWPKGAQKLLKAAQPMDQPVDNFMGWESREGRLNSWIVLDEQDTNDSWAGGIVAQCDFLGDSDIKKSDGGDQGDDPTAFLAAAAAAAATTAAAPADAHGDVDMKKSDEDQGDADVQGDDQGDAPAEEAPAEEAPAQEAAPLEASGDAESSL